MREWWRHPRVCGVPGPKCTGTSPELGPVPGPRLAGLTSGSQRPSGPLADARRSGAPQAARGPQARAVGSEAAARDCPARRCLCADMTEPPAAAVHSTGVISGQAWACSREAQRSEVVGSQPLPRHPSPTGRDTCVARRRCGHENVERRRCGPCGVRLGRFRLRRLQDAGPSTAVVPQPGATWPPPPPAVGSPSCAGSLHLTAPCEPSSSRRGPGTERAGSWVADGPGSGGPNPGCQQRL